MSFLLPIFTYFPLISTHIRQNKVLLITGKTGCGKTTQVPQYLVDKRLMNKVIVTSPTRICCINSCMYLNKMRKSDDVGYRIGGERENIDENRIEFQTTGVLKLLLVHKKMNKNVDCVIVDEIHERNIDTDTVLFLLKREMKKNKNLKVILMSATINPEIYLEYFKDYNVPVINVEQRQFDIKLIYLDQLKSFFPNNRYLRFDGFDFKKPKLNEYIVIMVCRLIENIHNNNPMKKSILIFLPGISEILFFERRIYKTLKSIDHELKVYLIHSILELSEQRKVFEDVDNKRKVILSTNITESSITIPDIGYVFDLCLFKEMNLSRLNGGEELRLQWCSQESLDQRAGRTGRLEEGIVFRMIPYSLFEKMNRDITPEIQRISLSHLLLTLMEMKLGCYPENVLKKFITCPDLRNIRSAYTKLEEVNAITLDHLEIKDFGYFALRLPICLDSSHLVYLGLSLGYLYECVILASLLDSGGSIIWHSFKEPIKSLKLMYDYSYGTDSDVLANFFAFLDMKNAEMNYRYFSTAKYCYDNFLNQKKLQDLEIKIKMIYQKLSIKSPLVDQIRVNKDTIKTLKILIACAFRSNIARKIDTKSNFEKKRLKNENTIVIKLQRKQIADKYRIRRFIEQFDNYGFGRVSDITVERKCVLVDLYQDNNNSHFYTPTDLITKFTDQDFKKVSINRKSEFFDEMPYQKAYTQRKYVFTSLFFPKRSMLGRWSVVRDYINADHKEEEVYDFVFGYYALAGENIFLDECTKLPSDINGLIDVIFLVFSSKIRKSSVRRGYLEIVQNNSLYIFKPLIDEKIIDYVNKLRRFFEDFVTDKPSFGQDLLLEFIQYYSKLFKSKTHVNYGNEVLLNDLDFVRIDMKNEYCFLKNLIDKVKEYLPGMSKEVEFLFHMKMKLQYEIVTTFFFSCARKIEKEGLRMTFQLINSNLKVEMIQYQDDHSSYNRSRMQKKMIKVQVENLLKKHFHLIRKYFIFIDIVEKKHQYILMRKAQLVIIPFCFDEKNVKILANATGELFDFTKRNYEVTLKENISQIYGKSVFRYLESGRYTFLDYLETRPLYTLDKINYKVVVVNIPSFKMPRCIYGLFKWVNIYPKGLEKISIKNRFSLFHLYYEFVSKSIMMHSKSLNNGISGYSLDQKLPNDIFLDEKVISYRLSFNNSVVISSMEDSDVIDPNISTLSNFKNIISKINRNEVSKMLRIYYLRYDTDIFVNWEELLSMFDNITIRYDDNSDLFHIVEILIREKKVLNTIFHKILSFNGNLSLGDLNWIFFAQLNGDIMDNILKGKEIDIKLVENDIIFSLSIGNILLKSDDFFGFVLENIFDYLIGTQLLYFRFFFCVPSHRSLFYRRVKRFLKDRLSIKPNYPIRIYAQKSYVDVLVEYKDLNVSLLNEKSVLLNFKSYEKERIESYLRTFLLCERRVVIVVSDKKYAYEIFDFREGVKIMKRNNNKYLVKYYSKEKDETFEYEEVDKSNPVDKSNFVFLQKIKLGGESNHSILLFPKIIRVYLVTMSKNQIKFLVPRRGGDYYFDVICENKFIDGSMINDIIHKVLIYLKLIEKSQFHEVKELLENDKYVKSYISVGKDGKNDGIQKVFVPLFFPVQLDKQDDKNNSVKLVSGSKFMKLDPDVRNYCVNIFKHFKEFRSKSSL